MKGGKRIFYGDVVEGTLVKAQPITGCWGFERGKKDFLIVLLSVCLSFCHSVCPTRINDKIYKLFMSIYPPGGRYVYVFTIQYAKKISRPVAFQDTLHHNRVFRTEPVSNKFCIFF